MSEPNTVTLDSGDLRNMRRGSMEVKMLSARQYEVINLFAEGYSRKEIAAKLCVSVKTVEAHKYNAMQALNLNTRVELFRWVRETRQQEVCRLREEIEQGLLLLARERVDSNEKLVAWARSLGAVGSV